MHVHRVCCLALFFIELISAADLNRHPLDKSSLELGAADDKLFGRSSRLFKVFYG